MSIVIDDIYSNIEFGLDIFQSMLQEKIEKLMYEKFKNSKEPVLNFEECTLAIEEAYDKSCAFISQEVYSLRNPPKWDSKVKPKAKKFEKFNGSLDPDWNKK